MDKKTIIDQAIGLLQKNIVELTKLKQQITQEDDFNSDLMQKIDKILDDTAQTKKGIIG